MIVNVLEVTKRVSHSVVVFKKERLVSVRDRLGLLRLSDTRLKYSLLSSDDSQGGTVTLPSRTSIMPSNLCVDE